mmetsp:Transcript_19334/g.42169  ORF Transcript_19334/g.42169 Transcript_19334/m.42169 type:complete len:310 (+) Transcript_19334:63-992(+)
MDTLPRSLGDALAQLGPPRQLSRDTPPRFPVAALCHAQPAGVALPAASQRSARLEHRPRCRIALLLPLLWAAAAWLPEAPSRPFLCGHGLAQRMSARGTSGSLRRAVAESHAEGPVEAAEAQDEQTLYEILGVSDDASVSDIKAAYRQIMKTTHPDLVQDPLLREETRRLFDAAAEAYRVLSDQALRQAYDLRGLAGVAALEFDGERVIMPPPWRVRIAHTGHHFWKREMYFVGLLAETVQIPISEIRAAYAEATKDPPGVGQAILIKKCSKKQAEDIVDALGEYGFTCLAQEIPEEELEDEDLFVRRV